MTSVTGERLSFLDGASHPPSTDKTLCLTASDEWPINDSGFIKYCEEAEIQGLIGARALITGQLAKNSSNAGLDIAGGTNGAALQDLLALGLLDKALVTNFLDKRTRKVRQNPKLAHVSGDILDTQTWDKVIDWTETNTEDGLSLVMHRPVGALQHLEPGIYKGAAHLILDILRPGGMLFSQIPTSLTAPQTSGHLSTLCESIQDRPDIEYAYRPRVVGTFSTALIVKKP